MIPKFSTWGLPLPTPSYILLNFLLPFCLPTHLSFRCYCLIQPNGWVAISLWWSKGEYDIYNMISTTLDLRLIVLLSFLFRCWLYLKTCKGFLPGWNHVRRADISFSIFSFIQGFFKPEYGVSPFPLFSMTLGDSISNSKSSNYLTLTYQCSFFWLI